MNPPPPYAPILILLLKGPVYSNAGKSWDLLFRHRPAVEAYFAQIGLELVAAEHDGVAFLRKRRDPDAGADGLPELTVKRQLPYLASLLCVLLAEELYRFESAGGGEARLVLARSKIRDLAAPFLPAASNEAKQDEAVNAGINNLVRYGFLRPVGDGGDELEAAKLLKHKIDAAAIADVKEKLQEYAGNLDA